MTETEKRALPTKLLWIDLEMTGLDTSQDVILEVAAIVTDFDFTPLATYEACVKHPRELVEARMAASPFWQVQTDGRDAFLAKLDEGVLPDAVEDALIALVREQFGDEPAILAGNSIYNDRGFIKAGWPRLNELLHYRMLDVSSLKILMMGKYGLEYKKSDKHRALSDIQESIAELQYYLEWLRSPK
jgi:oligoribonuclease